MAYTYLPNTLYFFTQKTTTEENYFINDKDIIVDQIAKCAKQFKIEIAAFAILSNHYHLLIKELIPWQIQRALQIINGGSSFLLNKRHAIERNVWGENKFNWAIKNEQQYYRLFGYILGNPLKHGLVNTIEELIDYPYSNIKKSIEEYGQTSIISYINANQRFNFESNDKFKKLNTEN